MARVSGGLLRSCFYFVLWCFDCVGGFWLCFRAASARQIFRRFCFACASRWALRWRRALPRGCCIAEGIDAFGVALISRAQWLYALGWPTVVVLQASVGTFWACIGLHVAIVG